MITFFLVGCGTMCHVCSFVKLHYHGKETNYNEKEQVVESIKTVFEESTILVQF